MKRDCLEVLEVSGHSSFTEEKGSRRMFSYITYGLRLASELPLPELLPSQGTADAMITRGKLDPPQLEATSTNCYCHITAEAGYLFWEQVGTFLVRG